VENDTSKILKYQKSKEDIIIVDINNAEGISIKITI
jgi:hypothetical protein